MINNRLSLIMTVMFCFFYCYQGNSQDFDIVYKLRSFNNEKDSLQKEKFVINKQQIIDNEIFLMNNIVYSSLTAEYLYIKHDYQYANKFINKVINQGMDNGTLFKQFSFPKYKSNSSGSKKTTYDYDMIKMIEIMFETEQNLRTYYRKIISNHKITDPIIMKIDSLNFLLLDSFYYKKGILPADSLIGYQVFDKLYLVIFHTIRRLSDQKWEEVKKVLDINLTNGILTNSYYAAIVDQYYKSKNLPLPYGTYLHDYKNELIEINKNRRKIGLLSYEETYGIK